MLNRTKEYVEKMKNAGFKRNEFSCRTPQDHKTGGWKMTEIHLKKFNIGDNLGLSYVGNREKVNDYIRSNIDGLLDNGIGVIELVSNDSASHFTLNLKSNNVSYKKLHLEEDRWELVKKKEVK